MNPFAKYIEARAELRALFPNVPAVDLERMAELAFTAAKPSNQAIMKAKPMKAKPPKGTKKAVEVKMPTPTTAKTTEHKPLKVLTKEVLGGSSLHFNSICRKLEKVGYFSDGLKGAARSRKRQVVRMMLARPEFERTGKDTYRVAVAPTHKVTYQRDARAMSLALEAVMNDCPEGIHVREIVRRLGRNHIEVTGGKSVGKYVTNLLAQNKKFERVARGQYRLSSLPKSDPQLSAAATEK